MALVFAVGLGCNSLADMEGQTPTINISRRRPIPVRREVRLGLMDLRARALRVRQSGLSLAEHFCRPQLDIRAGLPAQTAAWLAAHRATQERAAPMPIQRPTIRMPAEVEVVTADLADLVVTRGIRT